MADKNNKIDITKAKITKNIEIKGLSKEKNEALSKAVSAIEQQLGKGSIMLLGEKPDINVESIPTGSIGLDDSLGIGGLPKGRIIEFYGNESSGKTTLALHVAREVQKLGGTVAFIDAEQSLNAQYAKDIGVNIEDVIISQPDCGEQALSIAEALIRSAAIDLIIVDSVAALVPKAEIDGEMGDTHVGIQARLMSKGLRRLTGYINKTNCCVIFINQLREKIGDKFGSPLVTTGGKALKFYASVRIEIKKNDVIKDGDGIKGILMQTKIVKNKVAPPFKETTFPLIFTKGIDHVAELLDIATKKGIITKSGSWYSYGDIRLGQGAIKASEFLESEENKETLIEIENKVTGKFEKLQEGDVVEEKQVQ